MKNLSKIGLTFLLLLGFSSIASAQTSTSATATTATGSNSLQDPGQRAIDEQRINDQLTNQSADPNNLARAKYYEQTSATGGGTSAGKPNLDNLTDADRQTVNNYVHQEYIQDAMDEECSVDDDTKKACMGQDVGNGMVQALAQAYGMIVGMGGLGGDLKLRGGGESAAGANGAEGAGAENSGEGATNNNGEGEEKTRHDYCRYVAIVTEAVSMFQQAQAQNSLIDGDQASADTAQKAALYKAARSHQERAKTAKIQFAGWGITAGCYAAMVATGVQIDMNVGIKLAGSSILAFFFKKEIDKHQDAYEKTRAIADKLPGRGDCNPVSEVDCYCSMPSTQNDIRYCQKYLHDRMIAADSIRTTCVTNTLEQDPKCACVQTNTCFDQEFLQMSSVKGLPSTFAKNVAQPLASLSRGELTAGAVNSAGLGTSNAIKRQLRDLDEKLGSQGFTSDKKNADAIKAMVGSGLPKHVAAKLANTKVNPAALAKAQAALGGSGGNFKIVQGRRNNNNGVWGFGNNNNRRTVRRKKSTRGFAKKKGAREPSGKVLSFAEKASNASGAQINQDSSRPIFEIISRRYQLSGYSRLEIK